MCCEDKPEKIALRMAPSVGIDKFFSRQQTTEYNCLDFTRDVWLDLTGVDITEHLLRLNGAFATRKVTIAGVRAFKRLDAPANPCIAVMQRKGMTPHIGVYLDRRILHLHPRGVEFQPLAVAREYFTTVTYYK